MGKANVMVGILHAPEAAAAEGWQLAVSAAEGRNNTSWREKQLKAEVPVCVARGKSILCSAGLRLLAGSTNPVLVSCLASGQITRAKTIRAPRFRVLTNVVEEEEGEAGKRRSEGFKTGKCCLRQGNCEIGEGKQAR